MQEPQNTQRDITPTQKSKYEMNLAEFPISFLSKHKPKTNAVLEYRDTITGKNGMPVERIWRVKPSLEHGFGSSELVATLFELFQIWKENDFKDRKINFGSAYSMLKRMGLKPTETRAYKRLNNDLHALVEITIEAKNAFWDNEKKAYVSKTFHLFDSLTVYHRNPNDNGQNFLPFSFIQASETLMQTIEANALITLKGVDRKLFHSFTPTERRLALYLAKMLYNGTEHRRHVEKIAQQIPITAKTYKHTKYLLARACDGLIKKQYPYLANYHYEPSTDTNRDVIVFTKSTLPVERVKTAAKNAEEEARRDLLVKDILEVTNAKDRRAFYARAVERMPLNVILSSLSITKSAKLQNEIHETPDRYFSGLILSKARERGIDLSV